MQAGNSIKTDMNEDESLKTLIGWQGIRFLLPPDWNLTGFSMDRKDGYLKVDSSGSMFVQVKWTEPTARPSMSGTLGGLGWQMIKKYLFKTPMAEKGEPDIRQILDAFLKTSGKQAKKAKASFECKIRPETTEANGRRVALHFSWTGGGYGQGKIWYCRDCGRVIIAQVVGPNREEVSKIASEMMGTFIDHSSDGFYVWALYDLVCAVPQEFDLKSQKLMSGYLLLDFEKPGGGRLKIERWGLADVTLKKYPLQEWFKQACELSTYKSKITDGVVQEHPAFNAKGKIRGILDVARAYRESGFSFKPALYYEGCSWHCEETNKIYAIQTWRKKGDDSLIERIAERCECH
jgi:hypothetical protein